ncbi:ABC transporter domain-containing protein [Eremomyces bilateralis CBS 781.70]|uniref:ABC transporter domain-containing protein n=1 Tax=Eremomyces bilateralis CBS 781.70 TaxID=1392243 RepID=A0A6G1FQE2_9PEZI|nr:ABC transporter domain-containing protein [Eremomyces bilateralis CBS 781.70]KAF1807966.1 ABC transporter domain-containing protein [Eremomyces bilateralis CBS 781.70]
MRTKEHQKPQQIQVTAQQSRFHTEAVSDPTSKDVVVKSLSISIGQKEILTNAELSLKEGRRYVLAGRNGVGKSTLLRAMADSLIPGIPPSIRILLLGQTQSDASPQEAPLEDATAQLSLSASDALSPSRVKQDTETLLDHVVRSDARRERLLHEEAILSSSLKETADPVAAVQAIRRINLDRLKRKLEEAKRVAEKRSGARGAKARKELIQVENEVSEAEKAATDDPASNEEDMGSAHDNAFGMLESVRMELESMDASSLPGQARKILIGLGFKEDVIDAPLGHLSGGWRTRASIACSLIQPADVLLLDEPTNFLDLPSIIWLQQYLISVSEDKGTTILAVTHDRAFADAIAEELLMMRENSLERFRGTLSGYEMQRHKYAKWMTRMKGAQEKQVAHMKDTIESSMKAARRQGDDKKARQAASRKKKMEERTGLEVSAKGTRFKLNRDLAGYHLSNRAGIEVPKFDLLPRIVIKTEVPDLRFPGALVAVEGVQFSYPSKGRKQPRKEVLKGVNLTVRLGERVGIVGLNGSGKTTLVNLIMEKNEETKTDVKPTKGTITRHPRAKFGRYSQRVTEELTALGEQNRELTALAHLIQVSDGVVDEVKGRKILGSLGLSGKSAAEVPIFALSGGQKVRVAIALLLFDPPHLLVLDEVTTHLDSDTIVALVQALRAYEGALVVVSHDRFFIRTLVEGESISSFSRNVAGVGDEEESESSEDEEEEAKKGEVYRVVKGELRRLGEMLEYEGIAERAAERLMKKGYT